MENHFGEKFGNVGRDGEMGLQVPGATYLGLSDRMKMQVLEIWDKRETVPGSREPILFPITVQRHHVSSLKLAMVRYLHHKQQQMLQNKTPPPPSNPQRVVFNSSFYLSQSSSNLLSSSSNGCRDQIRAFTL